MTSNQIRLSALVLAVVSAAAFRLVPHPPNFTPIAAMALFSGAQFGRKPLAFVAPLGALLLSDVVLGFYAGMQVQYVATALIVAMGFLLTRRRSALHIAGGALVSSVLFFVVTNFGVWLTSGMYPATFAGLEACYVAAIPFFQNTVAGDLFYSGLLFGGFALLEKAVPALRAQQATLTA